MVRAGLWCERYLLPRSTRALNVNAFDERGMNGVPTGRSLLTVGYGMLIGVAIVGGLVILGLLTD